MSPARDRRARRAAAPSTSAIVAALVGLTIAGCGTNPVAEARRCTTTQAVVAKTAPALDARFDIAELTYDCRGTLAAIDRDRARIAVTAARPYPSARRLRAAVRTALTTAGWAARADGGLVRRSGATSYTATLTINSIAPALAIVTLANTRPATHADAAPVEDAYDERRLTPEQRLRFVTVPAFVPAAVPAGYASWGKPDVIDFDDVQTTLTGGRDLGPSLRSVAVPGGYTTRECDIFVARTAGDRCVLWGTSAKGIDVYLARDDTHPDRLADTPTAIVDGTLVALLRGHNHIHVRPALTRVAVLRIFDSLRAVNTPARR